MTYRSMFIEQYDSRESANAPFAAPISHRVIARLDDAAGTLWSFAKVNGLEPDHVDNCWMRVAVDGGQLRTFLTFVLPHVPHPADLATRIKDDQWFVINDEEF
jgi:hypothetical protein